MRSGSERRLALLLGAVCAIAVLAAVAGWMMPSERTAVSAESPLPGADGSGETNLSEIETRARESFQAMVERPLFTATRRPAPAGLASPTTPASTEGGVVFGHYRFTGIVYTPSIRIAFVTDLNTNRGIAVSEGETLGDWLFAEIGRASITLQSGDRRETITLRPPK